MKDHQLTNVSRYGLLAALLLTLCGSAQGGVGDIHPTLLPDELMAPQDTIVIQWLEPVDAILEVGPSASEWSDTVTVLWAAPGELGFTPAAGGLGIGAWAARLHRPGSEDTSLPFIIFVEAQQAPLMTTPPNGGEVDPGMTLLAWEPVLGVPYYHVLFSDQEIVIEEDEEGDPVIGGANIIWQAITPDTHIDYGSWDPSGFFNELNGTPPPLVAGPVYNWLVLNNYGNNPALSSTRQAGVSSFTVLAVDSLDAPLLLEPGDGAVLDEALLTFTWTEVPAAAHYHFYLSRMVDEGDNQGSVPVFDQVTDQTLLDLPAGSMLLESGYLWRVFAIDANGHGAASEDREFEYMVAMAHLDIRTRDAEGEVLPYVDVDLVPLGGGGNPVPIVTGEHGAFDLDLVPGDYALTASKTGYESSTETVSLAVADSATVTLRLSPSPALVNGVVRDDEQLPVAFADIHALNVETLDERTGEAGAGGGFQLGLSAGDWQLWATKTGYHAGDSLLVALAPDAIVDLAEPLLLLPNSCAIGGLVLGEQGQPIVAATVCVSRESENYSLLTDNSGFFQFSLDSGSWQIEASKPGFIGEGPRSITLAPGEDRILDPPLVLSAEAVMVSGFVMAQDNIVGAALVTATPAAGGARSALSGPMGDYQFDLEPGTWTLSAAKDGYSPGPPVQLTLAAGQGQAGVVVTLIANPCLVSGRVRSGELGLHDATVSNGSVSTQCDWNGAYSLSLPAGTQVIEAWKSGYGNGEALELELAPGQVLEGIDFQLSPDAATVSGRVLAEGEVVVGASVFASDGADTLQRSSDAAGHYEVSLQPGDWQLWASKSGMIGSDALPLTLGPGQHLPDQDLTVLPATVTLWGSVLGEASPLRDAWIRASSDQGEASTHSNLAGEWTLVVPAESSWTIEAGKTGYGTQSYATPLLHAGDSYRQDFDLAAQPALLSGSVRDETDQAVPGAQLDFQGPLNVSLTSDSWGLYETSLLPGNYQLSVHLPGYAPQSLALTLVTGAQTLDLILDARFASLAGVVQDAEGAPLPGATLTAVSPQGGGSATSGADGSYLFPALLAGNYEILVERVGYASAADTLSLAEEELGTRDWSLTALTAHLSGTVVDGEGLGLAGASLTVRAADAGIIAQISSDADGSFFLSALPDDRPLSLAASLARHAAGSENPLLALWAPLDSLRFILLPNDGVIQGHVVDAQTQAPLQGASVQVDDGQGYFGQAQADSAGYFRIEDLRSAGLYRLVADAQGWAPLVMEELPPDGAVRTLALVASPATVFGTLRPSRGDEATLIPAGSSLRGLPLGEDGAALSIPIPAPGAFALPGLLPGQYTLRFRIDGYLTEPRAITVEVGEGENLGPFDFVLLAAPLASLAVLGAGELDNDASVLFSGALSTGEGEVVDFPLQWSSEPLDAGVLDAATGRFTPRRNYIGEVDIIARHAGSGLAGRKRVQIFARLDGSADLTLDNGQGLALRVRPGTLEQSARITVQQREPSPIKRRAGAFRVEGAIYHFLPDGLIFGEEAPPRLELPLPNPVYNLALAAGWWDPRALRWEHLPGMRWVDGFVCDLAHFSDYALLVANEALGVKSARVTPNPFSPAGEAGGAWLLFTVSSQVMDAPLVDVEIFNMAGDNVRRLLERAPMPVGVEQRLLWDGLTDDHALARNGRYLVRIRVRDNSGEEETLLQAVLIK